MDRQRLAFLLMAGYVVVWTACGALVYAGDAVLHALVAPGGWLAAHARLLGADTLVLAGLYQFTPLKYHCLDKCRSPFGFITEHWRGRHEHWQARRLGLHHGLFCVSCCWSLMLLMFAVGVGNLGWMLVLGAVLAVEKNAPWGRGCGQARPL
jgi:predicted metal-binding membrane protein